MELIYESTAEFEAAKKALSAEDRKLLVQEVNRRGQLFRSKRRAFYKGLTQPVKLRLKYGGENAFYLMPIGDDWSVVFAACEEPYCWKETYITLCRIVPRAEATEVYESIVGSYYRAEGLLDESAEVNGRSGQTAVRRVRRPARRGKIPAKRDPQSSSARRARRA